MNIFNIITAVCCSNIISRTLYSEAVDYITNIDIDDKTYLEFNITEYTVHSIQIGSKYLHLKIFKNMILVKDDLILIESRNETIKSLFLHLKESNVDKKKILVISSIDKSVFTDKDLVALKTLSYERIFEGFFMLNAPTLYLKRSFVGFYQRDNDLHIQSIKMSHPSCTFKKFKITNDHPLYKSIRDYIVEDEHNIIGRTEISEFILKFLPIYKIIFEHFNDFNVEDWKLENIYESVLMTIMNPTLMTSINDVKLMVESVFYKTIVTDGMNMELNIDFNNFFGTFKDLTTPIIHSISLLYYTIENDHGAFQYIINDILNDSSSFHLWVLMNTLYMSGALSREEVSEFLLNRVQKPNRASSKELNKTLSNEEVFKRIHFDERSKLKHIFMIIVADRIAYNMQCNLQACMESHKVFEALFRLIMSLRKKPAVVKQEIEVPDKRNFADKTLMLFSNIFCDFRVFDEIKNKLIYGTLYAIDKEYLKNNRFDFYSYNRNIFCKYENEEIVNKTYGSN